MIRARQARDSSGVRGDPRLEKLLEESKKAVALSKRRIEENGNS
jgi:hypothetical protein